MTPTENFCSYMSLVFFEICGRIAGLWTKEVTEPYLTINQISLSAIMTKEHV